MKNKKILYIFISITLLIIGIGGLRYSDDLEQNNKETIFLTKSGVEDYEKFKEKFNEKSFVVVKKEFSGKVKKYEIEQFQQKASDLEIYCDEKCEILTSSELPKSFNEVLTLEGETFRGLIIISNPSFIKKILSKIEKSNYWGEISKDLHMVGVPFTNKLLNKYSQSIKKTLFPSLFIGVLFILVILFRSLKTGLLLFYPCLLSASLSLSTTKYFFQESNLITSIIPLLMFVINLSLVLHIFYTSIELRSLSEAVKEKRRPILLMIITTFIGFFSLYFSELQAVSIFGVLSASLIVLSSVTTIIWLISIDQCFNIFPKQNFNSFRPVENFTKVFFRNFLSKKTILIMSLIAIVCGGLLFSKIKILTDATEYFPKESGLKESINNVAKTVLGPPIIDIIVNFDKDITIRDLKKIEIVEQLLIKKLKKIDSSSKMLSSNIFTRKANQIYTGEEKIPDHMISYSTVRSKIPNSIKNGFPLQSQYRINILAPPMNVSQYEKLLNITKEIFKRQGLKISFNGLYYHLMVAQKEMITTLFKSFLASLFIISLIALLSFKKIKVFFIFLFVNIIPVFISFIFLKIFKISFNIATVMTYSISLGLIVDSSFHIIDTLDKDDLNYDFFYNTIVKPVISASLILSFCFLMFSFNSFLPIQEFGVCLSIIIFIGMFFDLKILPSLYLKKDKILS
jgi:uncharacterized protein